MVVKIDSDIMSRLEAEIDVLPLVGLHVDQQHYQRPLSTSRVNKYAQNWDLAAAGVITVNRRSNGLLYVVDGQHRALAAAKAGETEILAQVFNGLTVDQEARLFRIKNAEIGPMKAIHTFRAALQEGLPEAVDINDVVESLGGVMSHKEGGGHTVVAVAALQAVYRARKNGGRQGLHDVLSIIKDAFGSLERKYANGEMIRGLHFLLTAHEADGIDRRRVVTVMKREGIEGLGAKAGLERQLQGGGGFRNWYRALLRAYNAGRRPDNRLNERNRY